jgi:NAD(P)H-hydrate repair Nnr-like enzyme with NAD(P)H-hydrate epimerase domain
MDRPALPRTVEYAIAATTVTSAEDDDQRRTRVRLILGVLGMVPNSKPVSDRDLDKIVDAVFGRSTKKP